MCFMLYSMQVGLSEFPGDKFIFVEKGKMKVRMIFRRDFEKMK